MNMLTVDGARHQSVRHEDSWARGFENLPREHSFEPLRITGNLPNDLHGTFYWNGPGLLSAFGEPYGHCLTATVRSARCASTERAHTAR